MKIKFNPKNNYERFGIKIFSLLVENFSQTFFVGGAVRDLILNLKIKDIDIATSATPQEVITLLSKAKIKAIATHKKLGVILIPYRNQVIEVTTFRKETYTKNNRFPKISFTSKLEIDAKRRDFTINSIYLNPVLNKIVDPKQGLNDLNSGQIKCVGNAESKFQEDPLRMIRALKLQKKTNFIFEIKTKNALLKNFYLIKNISKLRIKKELEK